MARPRFSYEDEEDEELRRYGLRYQEDARENEKGFGRDGSVVSLRVRRMGIACVCVCGNVGGGFLWVMWMLVMSGLCGCFGGWCR